MKIGIFAYPTFLTDRYGGITLLNHTYDYLKRAGYDVHRFDPWTHRIEDFDLIHHFGLEYCNYDWFLTVKATGTKLAVTPIYWLPDLSRSQRIADKENGANLTGLDVLTDPFHEGYALLRARVALFVEHLEANGKRHVSIEDAHGQEIDRHLTQRPLGPVHGEDKIRFDR